MSASLLARSLALVALLSGAPAPLHAQAPDAGRDLPRSSVALMVGGLSSDIEESSAFTLATVRADWRLSRFILAEAGGSYARGEVQVGNYTSATPVFTRETTQLGTATVGIQAEIPLPYVRPYVGVATGLYLRLDPPAGHRFLAATQEFPVGVRIPVSDRLGVRSEARLRFDEQQGNGPATGAEAAVGVSWRF